MRSLYSRVGRQDWSLQLWRGRLTVGGRFNAKRRLTLRRQSCRRRGRAAHNLLVLAGHGRRTVGVARRSRKWCDFQPKRRGGGRILARFSDNVARAACSAGVVRLAAQCGESSGVVGQATRAMRCAKRGMCWRQARSAHRREVGKTGSHVVRKKGHPTVEPMSRRLWFP